MVINTPTNGSVTTSLVCVNCPLRIFCRNFGFDLVCLPPSKLDVILEMNWVKFNHVFINCFDKSVKFLEFEESTKSSFMIGRQVDMSLRGSAQVLMVFTSLSWGSEKMIADLHVGCEFPELFQTTSVICRSARLSSP